MYLKSPNPKARMIAKISMVFIVVYFALFCCSVTFSLVGVGASIISAIISKAAQK